MLDVGIIDVDSHNYPNLALMKISAYEKRQGNNVELWNGLRHYGRVYMAKVFDDSYTKDMEYCIDADEIIKGGTGYNITDTLPYEIEHIYPDYSLYNITDTAYGFLTRGCPRHCSFCIVGNKEGLVSHKVADISEFYKDQKYIELLDPNILACKDRSELLEQVYNTGAIVNFNQGLDIRLLDKATAEQLNRIKSKCLHFAWDNYEDNTRKCLERARGWLTKRPKDIYVYVLTNYNTTMDQDLYRIYTLRDMGYNPYVMIYNKPNAPRDTLLLQRWCNDKRIYESCKDFNNYRG